jgi:predicted dehydrogenase
MSSPKNNAAPTPLKIGLIGCGRIGRLVHLESLRRMPDAQVIALAEPDSALLDGAHLVCPGAARFADYRELLNLPEVDAVVICLPNALHAEAAIAALNRGKHVYLEKPLALTLDQGKSVIEAWRRSGRVGMIGFNYRFNPLHQELRRLLQTGAIGELVGARSVWTTASHQMPEWKTTRTTGGGVLLDLASHHFDLIRFWFGQDIVEVHASLGSHRTEGDTATAQLRLASGLQVESFFALSSIDDDRFEIYGRAGKLSLDRYNGWTVDITDQRSQSIVRRYLRKFFSSLPASRFAIGKLRAPGLEPSFAAALREFVRAAKAGESIRPDFEDGLRSLTAVVASEESAGEGRRVRVRQAYSEATITGVTRAPLQPSRA